VETPSGVRFLRFPTDEFVFSPTTNLKDLPALNWLCFLARVTSKGLIGFELVLFSVCFLT
jgi:hypothetical protein